MRREQPGGDDKGDGASGRVSEGRQQITAALAAAAAGVARRDVPLALCRACLDLLPVTGASVSLTAPGAVQALWCASDPVAGRLAEAQYTLGEGPCRSALELVAPVLAADLTGGPDFRRWPVFAQQAVELGARAVFSLPLGTGVLAIGTFDLYRDSVGALSERELRLALMVRDALTFAVLNLHHDFELNPRHGSDLQFAAEPDGHDPVDGSGVASWVEAAEADHTEVHQAVGMVMAQLETDPQQALDRLRAHAFAEGRTVTEVARDVVDRALRFQAETVPDAEPRRRSTNEEGR
ncbi:GAF and ANTAR domain-containing protein [Streptomyces sp. NBC_01304]|uniref:GAF and ANTAR domain-containing protein n=1 Tax=Streptomyces sp. NBC_01304 TaxID=2903818 RepID=UPI002E15DC35|nr:GAF and ANTAR domain-containing protein [Streptomyces sp. NBC_01304]